jgi:hypothetical protein
MMRFCVLTILPPVLAQPYKWSLERQEEAEQHFADEDLAVEYDLLDTAEDFSKFVQGPIFVNLLAAMDNNKARIKDRVQKAAAREKFMGDIEDEAKTATMDKTGVCDEDLATSPQFPLPPDEWLYLKSIANPEGVPVDDNKGFVILQTLNDLAAHAYKLQWQVDTMQQTFDRHVKGCNTVVGGGGSWKEDLIAKFPYLAQCGDHVWTIPPGTKILQLARSPPVCSFSFSSRTRMHPHLSTCIILALSLHNENFLTLSL